MSKDNQVIVVDVDAPANIPMVVHGMNEFKMVARVAMPIMVQKLGMDQAEVQKEMAFAIQIAQRSPDLLKVTGKSIFDALVNIGNTGLTLNPAKKLAYLIPRRMKGQMEAVFQPSYMGLIKVCTDPGGVLSIKPGLVFEGDEYEADPASHVLRITKSIALEPRSKLSTVEKKLLEAREADFWNQLIFGYSRAQLHNGAVEFDMMPRERLAKIFKLYVKDTRETAFSRVHPDEWCMKTVVSHHSKTLPKSDRAALAVDLFHRSNGGDLDSVLEGGVSPRSIDAVLSGHQQSMEPINIDGPCKSCGETTSGGFCYNRSCPDAIPPEDDYELRA